MPNMVFNYDKEKIEKLDNLAKKDTRNRSSYIQQILYDYIKQKGITIEPRKKGKVKFKKK